MRPIHILPTLLFVTAPMVSHAQEDVFSLGNGILNLFNNYIIPVLISLAVLFFVGNVIRYFIVESDDTDSRAIARQFGMYGILALVFIVAFWSIVNFFVVSFGFVENDDGCYPVPDWIGGERCGPGADTTTDLGIGDGFGSGNDDSGSGFGAEIEGSGDSSPTSESPSQPETPTTDSEPNTEDVPYSEGPLVAAQQATAEEVEDFLAELRAGESDLGPAGAALEEAGLFADLDDFSGNHNDLNRLQAAYRLEQMGELDTATYENLVSRTNNFRAETNLDTISPEIIQDVAVTESEWPDEITEGPTTLINERVAEYNEENPTSDDLNPDNLQSLLTNPESTLEDRYNNFNNLYDENSLNAFMTEEFSNDYLGYLNAERVLQGSSLDDLY